MSSKGKRRGSSESRGRIINERRAEQACERARERVDALCTQHDNAIDAFEAELAAAMRAGPPERQSTADLVALAGDVSAGYDALFRQIRREREQDDAALGGRTDWVRERARLERAERALRGELAVVTAARDALAADALTRPGERAD